MSSVGQATQVLRAALRHSSLRRALLAFLAFQIVEMAAWALLLVVAYQRGGATEAGLIALAQLVPASLVAPLGTAWAERQSRRRALMSSYAALSLTMVAIALTLSLSAPTWAFVVAAAASNCTVTVCRPAHYASLPGLAANAGELVVANSATSIMTSVAVFVGPMILPLLYSFLSSAGIFMVLAVVGATAVVAVATVTFAKDADAPVDEEAEASHFVSDALGGLRELAATPGALVLVGALGLSFVVLGALDVFSVVFPQQALGLGRDSASVLLAAPGVGGLVGALFSVMLATRRRMAPALLLGFATFGLCIAAVGGSQGLVLAALLLAGSGAGQAFVDVTAPTLLQRNASAEALTRVFGVQEAVYMGGLAVGAAVAPILINHLGVRAALVVVGLAPAVIVAASWTLLRRLDRTAVLPDPERLALLHGVSMFSALPQAQLELLVRSTVSVDVPPGKVIIRQGDVGESLYVVQTGRVRVTHDGQEVAISGRGQTFGEVALLHDAPRNATVTAFEPSRLLCLDRDTFLSVVTGHAPARDEANRVADERRIQEDRSPEDE
jgi:MFS family permease